MRKLVLSLQVSPDGFCNHDTVVVGEDWMEYINDLTEQMDTALFGRVTFELFEQFWPAEAKARKGPAQMTRFADLIDGMEKLIVSATLEDIGWRNSKVLPKLSKEVIDALKAKPGKDIIVFGGPQLISELILLDAFDDYYIVIQPVLAAAGYRLFTDVKRDKVALELVETKAFKNGVIVLHYRPITTGVLI